MTRMKNYTNELWYKERIAHIRSEIKTAKGKATRYKKAGDLVKFELMIQEEKIREAELAGIKKHLNDWNAAIQKIRTTKNK